MKAEKQEELLKVGGVVDPQLWHFLEPEDGSFLLSKKMATALTSEQNPKGPSALLALASVLLIVLLLGLLWGAVALKPAAFNPVLADKELAAIYNLEQAQAVSADTESDSCGTSQSRAVPWFAVISAVEQKVQRAIVSKTFHHGSHLLFRLKAQELV
jgi:hypothetical protein